MTRGQNTGSEPLKPRTPARRPDGDPDQDPDARPASSRAWCASDFSHGRTTEGGRGRKGRRAVWSGQTTARPPEKRRQLRLAARRRAAPTRNRAVTKGAPAGDPAAHLAPATATKCARRQASPRVVLRQAFNEEERSAATALEKAKVSESRAPARRGNRAPAQRATPWNEQTAAEGFREARKQEEDERRRHDEEAKRKAETEAKKRFGEGRDQAEDDDAQRTGAAAARNTGPKTTRNAAHGPPRPAPPVRAGPASTRTGARKRARASH